MLKRIYRESDEFCNSPLLVYFLKILRFALWDESERIIMVYIGRLMTHVAHVSKEVYDQTLDTRLLVQTKLANAK